MNPKALKHAVEVIEEEIGLLRKEIGECKSRTGKCLAQSDFFEKASILATVKKELDACSIRLEEIAAILKSLEQKKLAADALRSETATLLEKNIKQGPPSGEEDFSASSISPLA